MFNDAYITWFFAAMLVLALLLCIFWIEDKLEAQHAEVLARIDQLEAIDPLRESEAAGITSDWQAREEARRRQFNEQCG